MPASEAAQRNHEQPFPNRVPALTQTDPELIEHFYNFAFDEMLRHDDLTPASGSWSSWLS
jgi:hypothetical protein